MHRTFVFAHAVGLVGLSWAVLSADSAATFAQPAQVTNRSQAIEGEELTADEAANLSPAEDAAPQNINPLTGEPTIRFQFQETDWKDVIPWFADQAGFSLQPISDWPAGTFYLKDDSEYTVMQALDQLNHALRMRNPPFTLIRNRNMLILSRLEDANFPNELIETVTPDELDQRGKYETISCIFDLGELNVEEMYNELKPMISSSNSNFFAVFPAANQIRVRETGGTLRDIRDLIDTAKRRIVGDNQAISVYRLKHVDSETFMLIARGLLGMEPGRDATEDQSLTITREPFGDRLFVRGTTKMQARFADTAKVVDVPAEEVEGMAAEPRNYVTYPIMVDRKLGFDLLQSVLEGTGSLMQQDEVTGSILVLGRKQDHESVAAALAALEGSGGEAFEILKIENGDATEIMLAVQSLLRQTTSSLDAPAATTGPVLIANALLNQILVRGTPQEVQEVSRMVLQLDENSLPTETGPRTGTRIIDMQPNRVDEVLPMLDVLLGSRNRVNRLNIVMPDQRKNVKSRLRGVPEKEPTFDDVWKSGEAEMRKLQQRANPNQSREPSDDSNSDDDRSDQGDRNDSRGSNWQPNKTGMSVVLVAANWLGLDRQLPMLPASFVTAPFARVQQSGNQTDDSIGKTSQEQDGSQPDEDDLWNYRPAPKVQTVPGSPIEVRVTEYGIVLKSDDLDALDDLERAVRDRLGDDSEAQLPTFFFLDYRKAENLKAFLEQYFGLADSSGGAGGGGGLMGGMMNNMLGGGAGDLLGGLLGGGSTGGTGGAGELEGDVRFGMDVPFNAIYVAGATGNDLDQISELIDVLDQPEAPHEPDTIGQFRTIDILYRDPEELKTLIEAQIPDYIDTGKPQEGGQQNNEAQQMMKMLAQIQGKGGGGSEPEQEKPKARLGVDMTTKRLLVTGPDFIYQKILQIVLDLDKKELSDPPTMLIMPRPGGNMDAMFDTLTQMFPDKIERVETTEAESKASGTSSSGSSSDNKSSSDAAKAAQQVQEQARAQMIQMFQQQRGGQGGGGGGGRGGGGRGGASSGGGRGGR